MIDFVRALVEHILGQVAQGSSAHVRPPPRNALRPIALNVDGDWRLTSECLKHLLRLGASPEASPANPNVAAGTQIQIPVNPAKGFDLVRRATRRDTLLNVSEYQAVDHTSYWS